MIISIVSGTYNRLQYMKRMVDSVRRSIGVGIPYEIVLVDGGSTDGTIEFCETQSDIVLVRQGELLGAVKAFNAGFAAATGYYVVAANDDIEFVDESLICAVKFMQDNPDVGCGCFWQDRGGRDWHLEYMPAVLDGRQVSHIYGQVCIVPRWLGDAVGWWGDYLHTYGGDNELSCHVLELGYKVRAVPCACIHDFQLEDELRIHNAGVYKSPEYAARHGVPHTDSVTWGLHWTHKEGQYKGMCGPVIKYVAETFNDTVPKMKRILYFPIYEPGYDIQKISKRGLRDALAEIGLVYEYDYMGVASVKGKKYCIDYTFDLATAWQPDLFVFQIQGLGEYTAEIMAELRSEHPSAIFVNWNGDYHPETLFDLQYMALLKHFHLTGLVTTQVREEYTRVGIPWFYWQIGYEESDAEPSPDTPRHDVVFLANGYSTIRQELVMNLRSLEGYDIGLYGSWPEKFKPNGSTLYDFGAGQKLYRAAKLAISDNQWGMDATGFVSNRLFQAMAAGSNRLFQAMAAGGVLLLQQRFGGMELLGLRDSEHLVIWDDFEDLRDEIDYYMTHDDERVKIARTGTEEVLDNHSFDVRVMELLDEFRARGIRW